MNPLSRHRNIQTLESMLKWTAKVQPGRNFLQTALSPKDLREMGILEHAGKYHHAISVEGETMRFEIVPRKA